MKEKERIERIMMAMWATWNLYPDFRFGQLVTIIATSNERKDLFDIEDDEWEEFVHTLNRELQAVIKEIEEQEIASKESGGD